MIALTLSLLGLGIFNYLALRRLDVSYSVLVTRDLAAIGTVRDISRQSAESHRCLLNLMMDVDAPEKTRQKQKLRGARAANDINLSTLASSSVGQTATSDLGTLIQMRNNYLRAADSLIGLIDSGDTNSAEAYRIKTVRPAFDAYLQVQDELADKVYAQVESRSRDISTQSKRWQYYTLGLSTWPLLLAVFIFGPIAFLLLWLGWRMPDEEG